jgi:ABC-type lipoprotein release transport system permease subunit
MTSNSKTLTVLADSSTGVHYSPLFYILLVVVGVAILIVFFTVVNFVRKMMDRRSRG